MSVYGTDIGPHCIRCNGTIWEYTIQFADERVHAKCCTCHRIDDFQMTRAIDDRHTVKQIRARHRDHWRQIYKQAAADSKAISEEWDTQERRRGR